MEERLVHAVDDADEINRLTTKLERLSMMIDHVQTQEPFTRRVKMPVGWVDEHINPADSIPKYRRIIKIIEKRLAVLTGQ